MFSIVRKVVAGPKNTISYEGEELDLTYITPRVIAMAFPASGMLEKTYRNSIEDVASYLEETHSSHYLVINVSSRSYNYTIFKHKVRDYEWPDHQAPPLSTLVSVAFDMSRHLSSSRRTVVAVHCNHGKGRTGTSIIALFLLLGFHSTARQSLHFYNEKRFSLSSYGVDQPCQLRYLQFLEKLKKLGRIDPKLICYRLKGATHRGLSEDYYVNVTLTRSQQLVHEKVRFNRQIKQNSQIILSDVFIELFCDNWAGSKRVVRINYNLYFLNGQTKLRFRGQDVKVEGGHSKEFQLTLHLEYYCLCHLPAYQETQCSCSEQRTLQEQHWSQMAQQIRDSQLLEPEQVWQLFGGEEKDPGQAPYHKPKPFQHDKIAARKCHSAKQKNFCLKQRQQNILARYLASKEKPSKAADEFELSEGTSHEKVDRGENQKQKKQSLEEIKDSPCFSSA